MANIKTLIEEFEVADLEDGSKLRIRAEHNTEMGNRSVPGVQIHYLGYIVNYEPLAVERWAYQASKKGEQVHLLEDQSWTVHQDQFIKNSLVLSNPPKARVEVKTRSRKQPVVKEYELPFKIDL